MENMHRELIERMLVTRQKLIEKISVCEAQIKEARNSLNGLNNEICRLNGHTFDEPKLKEIGNYDCFLETTCLICGITKTEKPHLKTPVTFTKKQKKRIRKMPMYEDHDM